MSAVQTLLTLLVDALHKSESQMKQLLGSFSHSLISKLSVRHRPSRWKEDLVISSFKQNVKINSRLNIVLSGVLGNVVTSGVMWKCFTLLDLLVTSN